MTTVWKPEENIPIEVTNLLKESHPNYVLAILHVVERLKIQKRTGWLDHDINVCESIADHMYRMSITSMLITDPNVDRNRCVRIALVHDIAESLVGDITPHDPIGKDEKHRREWETIQYLCDQLISKYNKVAAEEIKQDWLAYENITCVEARYVKDIDKYEMLVQCYEYEKRSNGTKNLQSFWKAMESIKTDEVKKWAEDLKVKRDAIFT
ncbi:hypothetical protein TBLA_0A01800 [Henningerozyma blattae CBS 6284]|uniref:5'-deoxynucleotidase n=1 Tax=Henningerozyma blattae (strain ATCC 34711 / CBS 6284 / DSM 70876 / NBRC 10599 / NRRL Y-10934 / UCD 77-7) TaxID=1071380 RepID=I2GV28_HENB6|nr:hypothetical protein TBLA_0A01800 [Tetrapisispora blattae CBS 6284]CCH57980.1 hypothetical protein TBLA_0A01800 [Tetrapisispora blattae CBS 6284]